MVSDSVNELERIKREAKMYKRIREIIGRSFKVIFCCLIVTLIFSVGFFVGAYYGTLGGAKITGEMCLGGINYLGQFCSFECYANTSNLKVNVSWTATGTTTTSLTTTTIPVKSPKVYQVIK
jgi:hypothetical protein